MVSTGSRNSVFVRTELLLKERYSRCIIYLNIMVSLFVANCTTFRMV